MDETEERDWWDVLTPDPIPLFVELCAGTAAVSLRLADHKGRPPVSRMGAKTGYADAILRHLGLQSGQGALQYLWCEPDEGCRLLLEAYRDPELALEAADSIRLWVDEDPRELWDRLRAEGPPQGVTGREVARWVWTWGRSYNTKGPDAGFMPSETANGGRPWNAHPVGYFATKLRQIPALRAAIHPDARAVAPIPGAVVMLDPPYASTTGYAHGLPRADVVTIAERWAAAGATVAICEQEPIMLPGWTHVEISGARRGQVRTFSKQQDEWLTIWKP